MNKHSIIKFAKRASQGSESCRLHSAKADVSKVQNSERTGGERVIFVTGDVVVGEMFTTEGTAFSDILKRTFPWLETWLAKTSSPREASS